MAGVLAGNVLGYVRVAVTAYLLGTHSRADTLSVTMGPIDALNPVLINSIVFALVPMLAATAAGEERRAMFFRLRQIFFPVFAALAVALIVLAPWLMRALAPGLDPQYFGTAITMLRLFALSTFAAGAAAVYCALLYTDRRFAPFAFYSSALNFSIAAGALLLWKLFGIYAFAVGYTFGTYMQLGIVYFATRNELDGPAPPPCRMPWREILAKPAYFAIYAAGLGLNITFTRAWATHAGPGMAAALDYCMRGVTVPVSILVNPISNSLLPEIARLRTLFRWREAFRLIDRTLGLATLVAVGGCGFALLFRQPAIALLFERGEFHHSSTMLVSAVFLGLGPSLVSWSLIEILARSLFALDRPWAPVCAAAIPVLFNLAFTLGTDARRPDQLGLGATLGLLLGFLTLFALAHTGRRRWVAATDPPLTAESRS